MNKKYLVIVLIIIFCAIIIAELAGYFIYKKQMSAFITTLSVKITSCVSDNDCPAGYICNQACSTITSGTPRECAKKSCLKTCENDENCPKKLPSCNWSVRWTGDAGTPVKLCEK